MNGLCMYILMSGMTFLYYLTHVRIVVKNGDEEENSTIARIIIFVQLCLMALMWFITLPIIANGGKKC